MHFQESLFLYKPLSKATPAVICSLAISVLLASCGGGSENSTPLPENMAPPTMQDPDDLDVLGTIEDDPVTGSGAAGGDTTPGVADPGSQAGQVGLIVDSTQRCAVVSEPLSVVITRRLEEGEAAGSDGQLPNITGLVKFDQSLGSSLRLVSRSDESANFEMTAQDVVGLTASIDNGSVTAFMAGLAGTSPESFIMRKPVPNGCLYAFKSGDYCATGLSKSGTLSFSRNGASMSATGCQLENPNSLPVIEIAAEN